jgi:serine/threonine protein phosphatase PrpC
MRGERYIGTTLIRVILDKMKRDTALIENKGFYGPLRVFPSNITITRAMGCKFAKSLNAKIITAIPDILHTEIKKSDEFVLIACDSVFEHLSKEDIATIIRCSLVGTQNSKHCGTAVNNIIKAAALSRSKESLTCILIVFKNITLSNHPIQETTNKEQSSNELHVFKFKPEYPKKNVHAPLIRYNPPQKKRAENTDSPSPYSIM